LNYPSQFGSCLAPLAKHTLSILLDFNLSNELKMLKTVTFWPNDQKNTNGFLFPPGAKEVLSGTFAGLVGTIIGQPLDLVKVFCFLSLKWFKRNYNRSTARIIT
jgi:hypothetical protein